MAGDKLMDGRIIAPASGPTHQRRAIIVHAVQWFEKEHLARLAQAFRAKTGRDPGLGISEDVDPLTDVRFFFSARGDPDEPPVPQFQVTPPSKYHGGAWVTVHEGDWIVTFPDGRRSVVGPKVFEVEYESIDRCPRCGGVDVIVTPAEVTLGSALEIQDQLAKQLLKGSTRERVVGTALKLILKRVGDLSFVVNDTAEVIKIGGTELEAMRERLLSGQEASNPTASNSKIAKALDLARSYGGTDGDHHKAWVIDQIVRVLTGDGYAEFVRRARAGEDGPETYDWNVGIAP